MQLDASLAIDSDSQQVSKMNLTLQVLLRRRLIPESREQRQQAISTTSPRAKASLKKSLQRIYFEGMLKMNMLLFLQARPNSTHFAPLCMDKPRTRQRRPFLAGGKTMRRAFHIYALWRQHCSPSVLLRHPSNACFLSVFNPHSPPQQTWPRIIRCPHFIRNERFDPPGTSASQA